MKRIRRAPSTEIAREKRGARHVARIAATETVDLEEQALALFDRMSSEAIYIVGCGGARYVPRTATDAVDLVEQILALFDQLSGEQQDRFIAADITRPKAQTSP
jgi:hypothetical protein